MYARLFIGFVTTLLYTSCRLITPEFSNNDLAFIQWAEKGKVLTFVSNQNDTIKYYIIEVVDFISRDLNNIEPLNPFADVMKQVKCSDGNNVFDIMNIESGAATQLNIHIADTWVFAYPYKDFKTDTIINNVTYKEIQSFIKGNQRSVTKIIWSKHHGPLEYHTNDGKVWIRQNVNPNAIYPEVYTPPLSWSERIINFLGENMFFIFMAFVIMMVIYLKRRKR